MITGRGRPCGMFLMMALNITSGDGLPVLGHL